MKFIEFRKTTKKIACMIFSIQFLFCASCSADVNTTNQNQQSTKKMECKNPVEKSKAMIEFILGDLQSTYTEVGGGGISEIKQSHTNTFVISIPQEERIDQFTYDWL